MRDLKNVLLLYPRTGIDPVYPQPPLSLLSIAPYIEERGLTPVIIDQRTDRHWAEKVNKYLPTALFVGITSMTGEQLAHALEMGHMVRASSPHTPVVFGGIHATLLPEQSIAESCFDLVAEGEGEETIGGIIDYFQGIADISCIRGIHYREDGRSVSTGPRELFDLNRLRTPSWHLINAAEYSDFTIQAGRGCPHACTFCYNSLYNRGHWRFRAPEKVVEEIVSLHERHGIDAFQFIDDNFFTSFERVREICELILQAGIDIHWKSSFRADYFRRITPEFADLLARSGLRLLFVGAESGSSQVLEKIRKKITVEDIISAAEVSHKYRLPVSMSFMTGFPFETEKDREMTYALMDRVKRINPEIDIEGINIYTPYPGTDLFEESKQHGFRPPKDLSGWGSFVFNSSNMPWFSRQEARTIENISFISRFVFWQKEIRKRFLRGYYYPFYWILRISALVHWKLRFFSPAIEWDAFRRIRRKLS